MAPVSRAVDTDSNVASSNVRRGAALSRNARITCHGGAPLLRQSRLLTLTVHLDGPGVDQNEGSYCCSRPLVDPGMHGAALNYDVASLQMHDFATIELTVRSHLTERLRSPRFQCDA